MKTYRQLHRWHIRLGWLVGVPLITFPMLVIRQRRKAR